MELKFTKLEDYSYITLTKECITIKIEHGKSLKAKLLETRGKAFFVFILLYSKKAAKGNKGQPVEVPVGDFTTLAQAKQGATTIYNIINKKNHPWK
jgi:hypothetical protein